MDTNVAAQMDMDALLAVGNQDVTTLIDVGVMFEGKITVTNGKAVMISGSVIGSIESNGAIILNGGTMKGPVKAKSMQVAGLVERVKEDDLLHIDGPLVLSKNAVVHCDVTSAGIKMEYGAIMSGNFKPLAPVSVQAASPAKVYSLGAEGRSSVESRASSSAQVGAAQATAPASVPVSTNLESRAVAAAGA